MTGRDLIIYILEHGLENYPVFKDGTFIGFETEGQFAKRCNVGTATVRAWAEMGAIDSVRIGDTLYIPANTPCHVVNGGGEKR